MLRQVAQHDEGVATVSKVPDESFLSEDSRQSDPETSLQRLFTNDQWAANRIYKDGATQPKCLDKGKIGMRWPPMRTNTLENDIWYSGSVALLCITPDRNQAGIVLTTSAGQKFAWDASDPTKSIELLEDTLRPWADGQRGASCCSTSAAGRTMSRHAFEGH